MAVRKSFLTLTYNYPLSVRFFSLSVSHPPARQQAPGRQEKYESCPWPFPYQEDIVPCIFQGLVLIVFDLSCPLQLSSAAPLTPQWLAHDWLVLQKYFLT